MTVEVTHFGLHIETRAGLGDVREVTMTDNLGLGVALLQVLQEEPQ